LRLRPTRRRWRLSEAIVLEAITPATQLVLVDSKFVSALTAVEAQVATLKITDSNSAQLAADLQIRLTTAGRKLEEARKIIKQPFLDKCAEIENAARGPAQRIIRAKDSIKKALTDFEVEQTRIAEEKESERLRELDRLEKLRQTEEAEAQRKAAELAKLAAEEAAKSATPTIEIEFDDEPAPQAQKTETEKKIEAIKYAPVVYAPIVEGVRFKTVLIPTVEDISKVPDCFVIKTVNYQAIKTTFCTGYKEGQPLPVCNGVKFEAKREVDSTGRRVF